MAFTAPETTNFNHTPAPAGTHTGRCVGIVDLGMQESTYNNERKWKRKVRFTFELPNCLMTEGDFEGQPFTVSQNFNFSFHENAALTKAIEGWFGKKVTAEIAKTLDISKFLGRECTATIVHNENAGNIYANIASLGPVMQGMTCPPAVNPLVLYSIEDSTQAELEALPDWLRNKINTKGAPSQDEPQPNGYDPTQDEYAQQGGQQQAQTDTQMGQSVDIAEDEIPF